MSKNKGKKPFYNNNSSREKMTANSDDYDLKKNFQKVNSKSKTHKRNREETYYTDSSLFSRGNINDTDLSEPVTRSDSPSWEYTRLEDKISSYDKSNLEAHNDLRKELEGKIGKVDDKLNNYLSMRWYKGTISALVALVSIFYLFSYSSIVQLPEKVRKIEGNIEKIENKIKERKNTNIETKADSASQNKNKK